MSSGRERPKPNTVSKREPQSGAPTLDHVIRRVYDIGLRPHDPDATRLFMKTLADFTGSRGVILYDANRKTGEVSHVNQHEIDPGSWDEYVVELLPNDPRAGYAFRNPDQQILFDAQFIDDREIDRHGYYNWLQRHGLRYFVGLQAASSPDLVHIVSLQRTQAQGHITPAGVRRLEAAAPHIINALAVRAEMRRQKGIIDGLEAGLTDSGVAMVLLGGHGNIVHMSDTAQYLLAQNDGLSVSWNGVSLQSGRFNDELRQWLAVAVADGERSDLGAKARAGAAHFAVPRPSGLPPYVLRALPRQIADDEAASLSDVRASIVIVDPSAERAPRRQVVRLAYGLSEADADLCAALCAGQTLPGYASESRRSYETVRWRAKRVFNKLGVSSQHELVAQLQSLL